MNGLKHWRQFSNRRYKHHQGLSSHISIC